MRPIFLVCLGALLACTVSACTHSRAPRRPPSPVPPAARVPDLSTARELDQQGARAYAEGRYRQAIEYFRSSREAGGPPLEQWNVAKCLERLDEPEAAEKELLRYLDEPGLPSADRYEAQQELADIRKKPAQLTVVTTPPGAQLILDDHHVDRKTPASTEAAPGPHVLLVELAGYEPVKKRLELRFGRVYLLELRLDRSAR